MGAEVKMNNFLFYPYSIDIQNKQNLSAGFTQVFDITDPPRKASATPRTGTSPLIQGTWDQGIHITKSATRWGSESPTA